MIIIRIEHIETGLGLFRSEDKEKKCYIDKVSFKKELDSKHDNFPIPICDQIIRRHPRNDEFCAFKSIKQLKQWIEPSWFEELAKIGFKIYALHVQNCVIGEYQVLFKKEDILRKTDITELLLINDIVIQP